MSEGKKDGKRRAGKSVLGRGVLLVLVKLLLSKALSKVAPTGTWLFWFLFLGVAALVVYAIVGAIRRRRAAAPASRRLRRALGEEYSARITVASTACEGTLRFTDDALAFDFAGLQTEIRLADVVEVAFRPSRIVVRHCGRATADPVEFAGMTYADRQDLEWEFAVRCPEAVERGNAESLEVSGASRPAAPERSAEGALTSLDEAMARLGSSLAPPAERPNSAPPRSGLGCGLFAAPGGTVTPPKEPGSGR